MPNDVIQIEKPLPPAVVHELAPIVAHAKILVIDSKESHENALGMLKRYRSGERKIHDWFEPTRKAIHSAGKANLAARDGLIAPIAEARNIVDQKSQVWEKKQREEAEAKARELEAKARKEEEDRQILDAIAADEAGDHAGADAILAQPIETPQVTVQAPVAKVRGVSARLVWSAEVTSLFELISYVSRHEEFVYLLKADLVALNRQATSQQAAMYIPGVRAVSRTVRSIRED